MGRTEDLSNICFFLTIQLSLGELEKPIHPSLPWSMVASYMDNFLLFRGRWKRCYVKWSGSLARNDQAVWLDNFHICVHKYGHNIFFSSSTEQGDNLSVQQTVDDLVNRIDNVSNEMDFDPEALARQNQKLIFGDDDDDEEDFHLYLSESGEDDHDEKKDSNQDKNESQVSLPNSEPQVSSEVTHFC